MKVKTKQFVSVEMPTELVMRLNLFCEENSANRSALIRKLIEEFLAKEEKK